MNALSILELIIAQVKTGAYSAPRSPVVQPRADIASSASLRAPAPRAAMPPSQATRFIDIGANLLDTMFVGEYRGKKVHPPDVNSILARAADAGVERIIVTAGSLEESKAALDFVRTHRAAGSPVKLKAARSSS